jgi:hypothetical protein
MTRGPDYELEALLSLDGWEFRFTNGPSSIHYALSA